jgi:hypothetical protein
MSADPNKKSARTFHCRDVLWGTFEQMALDLECSVDYLINEAMKQYARQRSQDSSRAPYSPRSREPSQPGASTAPPPNMAASPASPPTAGRVPPPPGRTTGTTAAQGVIPPPPTAGRMPHAAMPSSPRSMSSTSTRTAPPPLPRAPMAAPSPNANGYPGAAALGGTLTLVYQGERFTVTKDRFVIGRGKQSSDLTLKDPNVSRQHAMIEFQNGVYFMVDMGSTNGIEFNGQRIARKQITEGDVFRICDHDLSFTYR